MAFEHTGAGFMLPSHTLARRPKRRWPSRLLAAILILIPSATAVESRAQTATPQEISSSDVEPAFKLQTERNMVMVRVVVRDSKGTTVDNLHQEDFHLFDHGKPQTILHFSIEKPTLKAAEPPKSVEKTNVEVEEQDETATPASTARRFLALYFDDVNTPFENLARARDAAYHFLTKSIQAGDRVALFTSSGQEQVDFTDNLAKLHQALYDLRPRPIIGQDTSCGAIPPYEAYQIVEQNDTNAIQVAADELATCNPCPYPTTHEQCMLQYEQTVVPNVAQQSLSMSETQSRAALRGIESVVRVLTSLPGQRSMVIVSGGFLTDTLHFELSEITDRALRAGVIVNAIDARGLYTDPTLDVSQGAIAVSPSSQTNGQKHLILMESARVQTEGMRDLALDTGGVFFDSNNDLETAFHKTAGLPEVYYVLAFSPQNLKLDGSFHPLQVKLATAKGLSVQARRGYYAPKKPADPTAQEKEDIQEAVYSQDETHELPIDVHTQFFMKTETDAQIAVLTRLDLHPLHFRKEENRNLDTLVFVTAVFDRDGHLVTGQQKSLDLRMLDTTLEKYLQTGITVRTKFDVKPGTYLVRAIVRDSESGQISGLNRTVEIPY
jgi:VWFA-related protein